MSNIPNNAMPHAGGTSANNDASRGATQTTGQTTGARVDSPSAGYAADTNVRNQQSDTRFAQSRSTSRQPQSHNEGGYQRQSGGSVMEKAREHKTGLAVGLAVGAIAATAIPLMFSGKKKNRDRQQVDYSAVYVENRDRQDARATGATTTAHVSGTADTPVVSASGRNKGSINS